MSVESPEQVEYINAAQIEEVLEAADGLSVAQIRDIFHGQFIDAPEGLGSIRSQQFVSALTALTHSQYERHGAGRQALTNRDAIHDWPIQTPAEEDPYGARADARAARARRAYERRRETELRRGFRTESGRDPDSTEMEQLVEAANGLGLKRDEDAGLISTGLVALADNAGASGVSFLQALRIAPR